MKMGTVRNDKNKSSYIYTFFFNAINTIICIPCMRGASVRGKDLSNLGPVYLDCLADGTVHP